MDTSRPLTERLYVATIAEDALPMAKQYGLGIELDTFCTAANMQRDVFPKWDQEARGLLDGAPRTVFHAPFNELFPAAIDPIALRLAYHRYEQSARLARSYGIRRMVVHSGYVPFVYFKSWFVERSILFWRNFMAKRPPDFFLMIENVLEEEPDMLLEIMSQLNDPRVGVCLDVGHVNALGGVPVLSWIEMLAPFLTHVHLHNNNGTHDQHNPLGDGVMDMEAVMDALLRLAPDATFTIESLVTEPSLLWLRDRGWL